MRTNRNSPQWDWLAPPVTPILLAEARCAMATETVQQALRMAGFSDALRPEAVHQALALELAATARHAAFVASAEGRALDAGCVLAGSQRHAAEMDAAAFE